MRIRLLIAAFALASACALADQALGDQPSLSADQRAVLHSIAGDTWKFYDAVTRAPSRSAIADAEQRKSGTPGGPAPLPA